MVANVVMLSFWRNDAERDMGRRMLHLLQKAEYYRNMRFLWVVGDSEDKTEKNLRFFANLFPTITVLRADSGIEGDDPKTRLLRLSLTANAGLEAVLPSDDYVLIHESDLVSPKTLVASFAEHAEAGRTVIAGWPILHLITGERVFYDTFGYRADGECFRNKPPYHPRYQANQPFEVDSVGSCWMFPASFAVGGLRCVASAVLDLCAGLKMAGQEIWVDPSLTIVQPIELWTPQERPF